jgi:hypothetical protein
VPFATSFAILDLLYFFHIQLLRQPPYLNNFLQVALPSEGALVRYICAGANGDRLELSGAASDVDMDPTQMHYVTVQRRRASNVPLRARARNAVRWAQSEYIYRDFVKDGAGLDPYSTESGRDTYLDFVYHEKRRTTGLERMIPLGPPCPAARCHEKRCWRPRFFARSRHARLTSTMRSGGPDADTRDAALARPCSPKPSCLVAQRARGVRRRAHVLLSPGAAAEQQILGRLGPTSSIFSSVHPLVLPSESRPCTLGSMYTPYPFPFSILLFLPYDLACIALIHS